MNHILFHMPENIYNEKSYLFNTRTYDTVKKHWSKMLRNLFNNRLNYSGVYLRISGASSSDAGNQCFSHFLLCIHV